MPKLGKNHKEGGLMKLKQGVSQGYNTLWDMEVNAIESLT